MKLTARRLLQTWSWNDHTAQHEPLYTDGELDTKLARLVADGSPVEVYQERKVEG